MHSLSKPQNLLVADDLHQPRAASKSSVKSPKSVVVKQGDDMSSSVPHGDDDIMSQEKSV